MTIELEVKPAALFSNEQRNEFKTLVQKDPQVSRQGLLGRISRAHFLAYLTIDGEPAGTNAIKNNRDHQRTVEDNSGVKLPNDQYLGEVGYLHVAEKWRGRHLGDLLTSAILAAADKHGLFATIQSKNIRARHLHERHGFHHVGTPWGSEQADDMVYLYIRNRQGSA